MEEQKWYTHEELQYLRLLSKEYPNAQAAATEIINLNAILNLPKATEHFMSDIHGEYEAFDHMLRSASGAIRDKVDDLYKYTLPDKKRAEIATIIYYPEEKLRDLLPDVVDKKAFYAETLNYLIEICHLTSAKYTRSKVRKALPPEFAYVIDELINTDFSLNNKREYYDNIIHTIIDIGRAEEFIVAVSSVIKRLVVDRLHIVGDIYDRGPRADIIMEELIGHHSIDIQWGNHDIVWMGAAAGSKVCIATVLSNSILYNNLRVLESGYGISLRPLSLFANEFYAQTDTSCFATRIVDEEERAHVKSKDLALTARMSKAITIILFKLSGQLIMRNPDFGLEERLLLDKINYDKGTITLGDNTYNLIDCDFPTIDLNDPYKLTEEEEDLMNTLAFSFKSSEKLQKHIKFLYSHGSIYKIYNGNLLFHGGVPMNEDGSFKVFKFGGKHYAGKGLFDYSDAVARQGYFSPEGSKAKEYGMDFMWYLWCGGYSPLFARDKITTFERRFINDKTTWVEKKDPYYEVTKTAEGCLKVLNEFGIHEEYSHIINGHTPVKSKDGESPIKGEGKLFLIDGGFSKAYQKTTGIAGYTMVFNSNNMRISAHMPFQGKENAIKNNNDVHSSTISTEQLNYRIKISGTDIGKELQKDIAALQRLLDAYNNGIIHEHWVG